MAFWLKPNTQRTMDSDGTMMCELYADEMTDLADNLEGVDLAAGSIALVIATGDFYVFNSSGEWVNVTATEEPAASVNSTRGETKAAGIEEVNVETPEEEEKESVEDDKLDGDTESEQRTTRKR